MEMKVEFSHNYEFPSPAFCKASSGHVRSMGQSLGRVRMQRAHKQADTME